MKKLIDFVRSVILHLPTPVSLQRTDRFCDNSTVVISLFGISAGYVVAPNEKVSTFVTTGDISVARRTAYRTRELLQSRWIRDASCSDLLLKRDQEADSSSPDRDLITSIQRELDERVGYRVAA